MTGSPRVDLASEETTPELPAVDAEVPGAARHAATLARALLAVHDVVGVARAAELVLWRALPMVEASAGAVLVRDNPSWTVAAGHELRPLEYRFAIGQDHWLVQEIAMPGRGALIQDSDVARPQLYGAPLAERRHLLVAAPADAICVVLLARDTDPAFSVDELRKIADEIRGAAALIEDAIVVRELARRLTPLADWRE